MTPLNTQPPTLGGDLVSDSLALPGRSDIVAAYRENHPEVDAILRENEEALIVLDEAADAAMAAFPAQRRDFEAVRGEYEQLRTGPLVLAPDGKLVRANAPPEDIARAERALAEARVRFDGQGSRRRKHIEQRAHQNQVVAKLLNTVAAMPREGVEPDFVPPGTFDGPPVDAVEDKRAMRLQLQKDGRATDKLPRLQADVLADAIAELDAQIALPEVKVRSSGVRLNWPMARVAAEPVRDAGVPAVVDLKPIVMGLAREQLVEHITKAVQAHYEALEVQPLSDAERAERIADIDRQLHEAERVEVAAIRAARKAGHAIAHRPDVSVDVVLGLA